MHEIWTLLLAGAAGAGLGLGFYGGLWLTVRRLATARRPALLLLASFLGRVALTLLGFYLLISLARGAAWAPLTAALAGFILARVLLIRRLGPAAAEEERHGSHA